MDNPLSRTLQNVSPSTLRALALMTGGLVFAMLPCGVKPGKIPASLMLLTSTAMLTAAIAPLQRWEKEQEEDEKLKRAEEHILHARLTAQTLGAVEQAKQEFMPQTYSPQVLAAQVQAQMQQAIAPGLAVLPAGEVGEAAAAASTQFEELDLAAEAAASDKSLLVSGITGVGKTRFVQHFIHAAHREYAGEAVFDLISFKSTTAHFCGLEKTRYYIESGASGSNYESAASKVESVVGLLDRRVADLPYYLIADEINNGIKQAEGYTETEETPKGTRIIKTGKQATEELKRNLSFIVTQGRERKIRGVFTAHGNLMSLLGIDGDTAQSLVCAVLGRKVKDGDGFALIEKALQNQVFFSKGERHRLTPLFQSIKVVASQTGQAIALTNIQGSWELVFLPRSYAIDPGAIQWEPQNASTSKIYPESKPEPTTLTPDLIQAVDGAINESPADYLNRMLKLEIEEKKTLSKPAQAILDKYQAKEMYGTWIDARWVKNHVFRSKDLIQFSAEDIRAFLVELAACSVGAAEGEGASLRWYYDPSPE